MPRNLKTELYKRLLDNNTIFQVLFLEAQALSGTELATACHKIAVREIFTE